MRSKRSEKFYFAKYAIFLLLPILAVLLGYVVTNFIIIPYVITTEKEPPIINPKTPPDNKPPVQDKETNFVIPTFYAVQMGAFSKSENSRALLKNMEKDSLPGIVHGNAPFRVYSGVFINKENAVKWGNTLKDKGYDTYIRELEGKEFSLKGNSEITERLYVFIKDALAELEELQLKFMNNERVTIKTEVLDFSNLDKNLRDHMTLIKEKISQINGERVTLKQQKQFMELLLYFEQLGVFIN